MEENKKYILSTRPLDEPLISRAAGSRIIIHSHSFIYTEPIINDQLQQEIIDASEKPLTVVFTSMNAAEAVGCCLAGKNTRWTIFCLGTATRKTVEMHFGNGPIAGIASNASDLAQEIINKNVESVVFFCGDQRRDELPDKLAAYNIQVHEVVVYKTLQIPKQVERDYDGILFFSPSAVESFFSSNTVSGDTIMFAIGTTTAESIRQFTNNMVVESDFPGKANLVEKAISYLDKSNQTNDHIKE